MKSEARNSEPRVSDSVPAYDVATPIPHPGEGTDSDQPKIDLRTRTKAFASAVVRFYCTLPKSRVEVQVLGRQLLRSGTSVAANYREAARARSDQEFTSKIDQCAQEADESVLWLELLRDDCGVSIANSTALLREADELIAIFVTMSKKVKSRLTQR